MEEWRKIEGFEQYEVSSEGRVRSLDKKVECKSALGNIYPKIIKGKILTPYKGTRGYYVHNLVGSSGVYTYYLHKIIANTFVPNPENKKCIDHINRDKLDNTISNLRWATHTENALNKDKDNDAYIWPSFRVKIPGHPGKHFKTREEAIEYRDSLI